MKTSLKLHALCSPERVPYATSDDIPRSKTFKPAQPRALQALELALHIDDLGYNIYLAGEPNIGRNYIVDEFLKPYAKKKSTPPDLIYVNNFEDQDKPILLRLPAGLGKEFKLGLSKTVQAIRKELLIKFESDSYIKTRSSILDTFNEEKSNSIKEMNKIAEEQGFFLDFEDKTSLTLFPLVDGKKLSEEEFDTLDKELQEEFKKRGDALLQVMSNIIRKITKAEQDSKDSEKNLDKSIMQDVLNRLYIPFATKVCKTINKQDYCDEAFENYLKAIHDDMLENFDIFLPKEPMLPNQSPESWLAIQQDLEIFRYEVNLFVDHSQTSGAPIIVEANPTAHNLLGCIEREAEMGVLTTDFTLIKAGTLHKALGGYIIIHIDDILQHPNAWEGLLRSLRSGVSRISEASEQPEISKTKSIEPQDIPLSVKIILIGTDILYENLMILDERFNKFFKIKAQLSDYTLRNSANIKSWINNLAVIIDEAKLLPFTKSAMASLVDYSSLLCENQRKISLKFPLIREVMIESSTLAKMENKEIVDETILQKALDQREHRQNYLKEVFFEEYSSETIKICTDGYAVGKLNGLSLTSYGDYEFGMPHQIACTVGVGHGGIIDLEREAELSGPIHIKAMMILKGYLVSQFARNKPLVFTGSICFEQSYAGVEGDSASGAELCTLISALSDVPLNLALAFTGAVSQSGDILAVGGVTKKIEGYFDICNHRGLTGSQGVIMPYDNKDNLMLNKNVQEAVNNGKFHIYPVKHITEALALLVDIPCGKLRKDDTFTPNSLFDKVDTKLKYFGWCAENSYKRKPRIK